MKHLLLIIFLLGCDNPFVKDNEQKEPTGYSKAELNELSLFYCDQSFPRYLEQSYVHARGDGLLFTSLHGVGCQYVNIDVFEKEPGLWKRDPSHTAYEDGNSATGLSRDMLLGLLIYAWHYERLDIVENLITYGRENSWEMCGGEYPGTQEKLARCVVTPALKATIYEVAVGLGSECDVYCDFARAVPQLWDPYIDGFQAHLLNIHILLRGLVQGALNDNQLEQLSYQADKNPDNALFLANYATWTDGDMGPAVAALNTSRFPKDRLPNSSDRCEEYLWQRDLGSDWEPCEDGKTHYGTDFIFSHAIISGKIRKKGE